MATPTRAVIYARVSTLLSQDPEHQLVPLRETARNRGYDVVGEYTDRISGATPTEKRKALDELVRQARVGKFKVILIYALDRLGRDLRHLLNLLHELDEYGITVISVREALDFGSPMGRACIALIGILSQLEREWISQRIKTALAVKRMTAEQTKSGWRCGRPSKLTPELEKEIHELRDGGLSIRQIARRLSVSKSTVLRVVHKRSSGESPA